MYGVLETKKDLSESKLSAVRSVLATFVLTDIVTTRSGQTPTDSIVLYSQPFPFKELFRTLKYQ